MDRYEDGNESLVSIFLDVLEKRFYNLAQLNFKLVFDIKKRIKQGKICLASVERVSPKTKFLSIDEKALDGYDLLMVVDKKAWELASDQDKKRLISHELCHVFIDDKDKLKIVDHDITDFAVEVKLNIDDPDWSLNLSTLTHAIYEQDLDRETK